MSSRKSGTMCAAQKSDILMIGYLVKLKTNKRKYFVLRKETDSHPSQLEYYDNEKKYKAGGSPKRAIILKNCFNINNKTDCKQKFVIAIYTKEDCFSVQCKSDEEREEWLNALLELHNENATEGDEPRPFFEHIWQVNVKPRGLANGKNLSAGPYRLCLTNKTLSLVRLNQQEPDIVFQLASLRRCGHSDCFFFMEAGSSAVTGAGELWMQVEDTIIARNIHETILSSMRSIPGDQPFRPRSRSSVSDRRPAKPISVPSNTRGASPGYESATLPKRSKTISGEHPGSPTSARLRPGSKVSSGTRSSTSSSLGRGHSPVPTSPLSQTLSDSHRSRTDSMESRGSRGTSSSLSADEFDLSPHDHLSSTASTRSVTPEGGIREDSHYLPMTPTGIKEGYLPHGRSDSEFILPTDIMAYSPPFFDFHLPHIMVSPSGEHRDGYMEMTAGFNSSRDSYMDMSPGDANYLDMQTLTSISSSPAVSSTSSGHDTDDHGYLDMAPIAHSLPTVQEKITDGGYLDMSQGSPWSKSGGPFPRPDRVHSYLSDDQSSACSEDFPKRAYSVGSKPTTGKGHNQSSYMDMSGRQGNLDKITQKSSSAPHLVDKEKGSGYDSNPRTPKELVNLSAIPNRDLFMEFDFYKRDGDSSNFRPRTSSAGKEFRPRTSSIGQEMRRRAGSFGRDCINRTASIGRHDRQRTTSVCQDAFRNRTSSFGSCSDARPRSSSYGSRSHYKGRVSDKGSETNSRSSSRHSSQESVRRSMQRATEDLANRAGGRDVYVDMSAHRTPSPSTPTNATSTPTSTASTARSADKPSSILAINSAWREDEYFSMTPGKEPTSEGPKGDSYMDLGFDHDRSKDKELMQRRRSIESGLSKSSSIKSNKQRTRPSMKPQSHRLQLRMPSTESNPGLDQLRRNSIEHDLPPTKSPGEYIDLGFSNPKETKPLPKQKSHDEADTKVPWTCQPDGYAMFSPGGGGGGTHPIPPSPASLEDVVCPLRLDDDDDKMMGQAVDPAQFSKRPNYSLSGLASLNLTPQTNQLTPSGISPGTPTDPFNLISSPPSNDNYLITNEPTSTPSPQPLPIPPSTVVPEADTYVEISLKRSPSGKSRKSPVLPPKIKTKSQKHLPKPDSVTGKPTKSEAPSLVTTVCESIGTTSLAELDYMDCSGAREQLRTTQSGASGTSPRAPVAVVAPPFSELVTPIPVSCVVAPEGPEDNEEVKKKGVLPQPNQQPALSGSTSSLSSIEPVMSSASPVKPTMPSRGSTSSLPAMDRPGGLTPNPGLRLNLGIPLSKDNTLQPTSEGSDTEGTALGDASIHSSHTSVNSDRELNYASLDLASSMDEATFPSCPERSPRSPLLTKNTQTSGSEEVITPLAYAEIDFNKSEELRTATNLRERVPFDVK